VEKLIITLAPTGNVPTKEMTPHVPLSSEEIAADIIACHAKGASVAHIHARNEQQLPTTDINYFAETVRLLDAADCPIIKQISTGARGGKSDEARYEALSLKPDSASLATGSSNFPASVNANSPKLVEHMAELMLKNRIKPEIEVFDSAMISNALYLRKKGLLADPLLFNLVLGVRGSLEASARNLFFLVESLPPEAVWSVSVIGPQHVALSTMAMALGGHVRVGIEDNVYLSKGVLATNAAQVDRIAAIARAFGRELATPADVKRIWGIA
jgi:3-keto-5-aminohexanoate cleavage enzyme